MPDELDLLGPVRREYDERVSRGLIDNDPAQVELVTLLDQLIRDITAKRLSAKSSALGWLFGRKADASPTKDGLYIWGGVGRGKSYLMDLFFEVVDMAPKRRIHFNDFMQEAHQHIHNHRQIYKAGKTDKKDPIPPVAKLLATKSRLLCFDEFSVSDIADAMLLGRLFKVLFEEGVIVVATSNIDPCDLYKDGLNRQLFLPFIELLKSKLTLFEMASGMDYRLSKLPMDRFYSWPLNERAKQAMNDNWDQLTGGILPQSQTLNIAGGGSRQIIVPAAGKGVARFDFDTLCRQPRGVSDYLAIAHAFSTIMIDDVPVMLASERNEAKRFISLIDVLYDNRCRLVISADGPPQSLYQAKSGREAFEFERTCSRLIEMQSSDYNRALENELPVVGAN